MVSKKTTRSSKPSPSQPAQDTPKAVKARAPKAAAPRKARPAAPKRPRATAAPRVVTEDDIRVRAYFLSLEYQGNDRDHMDFWLLAERELRRGSKGD